MELQSGRFEAVGTRRIGGHRVSDDIAAGALAFLTRPGTNGSPTWGERCTARHPSIPQSRPGRFLPAPSIPVRLPQSYPSEPDSARISRSFISQGSRATNQVGVNGRLDRQRSTCPCQQSAALSDHPIHGSVEIHHSERGSGGPHGNEGCDRTRRGDLNLVNRWSPSLSTHTFTILSGIETAHQQRPFGMVRERSESKPPGAIEKVNMSRCHCKPNGINCVHYPPSHSILPKSLGACIGSARPRAKPTRANTGRRRHQTAHLPNCICINKHARATIISTLLIGHTS